MVGSSHGPDWSIHETSGNCTEPRGVLEVRLDLNLLLNYLKPLKPAWALCKFLTSHGQTNHSEKLTPPRCSPAPEIEFTLWDLRESIWLVRYDPDKAPGERVWGSWTLA